MKLNFQKDIILENDRVKLLPFEEAHYADLLGISLKHPKLLQYSPSPFGSEELFQQYVQEAVADRENERRYPFVIYDKLNQTYVGSTSLGSYSYHDSRIEIGWTWIDPQVQGSGLNAACKELLLDFVFQSLKVIRLEFRVDESNLRSRKALEKLGAIYEGCLRSHTLMLDGRRRNTCYYAIIKE